MYLPVVQFPISPFHWLSSQVISQWEPVALQVTIALFPLCLIAYWAGTSKSLHPVAEKWKWYLSRLCTLQSYQIIIVRHKRAGLKECGFIYYSFPAMSKLCHGYFWQNFPENEWSNSNERRSLFLMASNWFSSEHNMKWMKSICVRLSSLKLQLSWLSTW